MFAWIRDDPEALVVWVESLEAKEALIAADPGKFFTTSHYDGQPIVLVRLEAAEVDEARELVTESWRVRAPRSLTCGYDGGAHRPSDSRSLTGIVPDRCSDSWAVMRPESEACRSQRRTGWRR